MRRSFLAIASLALTAIAGCSAGPAVEVKLGVDVAALQTTPTTTDTQTGGAATGLSIERVRLLVNHAKIGYRHEQAGDASADVGPTVVELTADEIANGAHREFSLGTLPSGTYGGAEIEIEPLDGDADTSDAALADFAAAKASVLVDGTYQGKAFSFAGHFLAEQGTDGDVTVDASQPVALAMTVDTSAWFLDANGAAVDPSDTTQHDALAVAVCKTLDTEPQLTSGDAPTAQPQHHGGHGGHGGPGGGDAHCVEQAQ